MKTVRNNGFTLAEVLVASTISAFIALVGVGALKAVTDSAQIVDHASESVSEVRFAARMLARDLANIYFDPNPRDMKLIGASQGSAAAGPPYVTFYMVGRAQARADQPEGDVYEVEYMLGRREEDEDVADIEAQSMILFRRLWPNPDEDRIPGGVLTAIAENISVFDIRFFDGEQWFDEWPEEMETMPELLEVSLGMIPEGPGDPVVETFVVNCSRLTGSSSAPTSGGEEESEGGARNEQPQDEDRGGGQGNAGNVNAR
jgi:general secretion pathway protein J